MSIVSITLICSLGDDHVGYKRLEFPMLKLSVVGGRPFSCGGNQLFRKQLLTARFACKLIAKTLKGCICI